MFLRLNLKPGIGWLLLLILATPALAHQVDVAETVGGTLHITPNDMPRAGEGSLAWFALTRRGGEVIPLTDCDCKLAVYAQPYDAGDTPIAQPELTAVSAEGYTDIPGTEILFPRVGAYELVLMGQPNAAADFTPFELRFEVTVAVGQTQVSPSSQPTESAQSSPLSDATSKGATDSNPETESSTTRQPIPSLWRKPVVLAAGILAVGALWGIIQRLTEKSKENSKK